MATNEILVDAGPDRVFAVLSDPDSYGHWVVGSSRIRDADPAFPAQGTRFHHTQGVAGLGIKDHTEVLEVHAPHRLVLRAKARPLGTARVALDLTPEGGGTRVRIDETLVGRAGRILPRQLTDPLIKLRNTKGMRRLKKLAEQR